MSPIILYHATSPRNRQSILYEGLVANPRRKGERHGVYAFSPDLRHDTDAYGEWAYGPSQDLWQIAYIGQLRPDMLIRNGVILPDVTSVTLVTGNV